MRRRPPVRWVVEDEVAGLAAAAAAHGRLPQEQREAIVAPLWGGLSFEQVAAVADCSASTAFRRYAAGIESLRQLLGEPCPDHSKTP